MPTLPNDLFVMLVILAMSAFAIGLGFVSLTDRDPAEDVQPAE